VENGVFKWRPLLLGILSFICIKNLLAQSGHIASTKQNVTTKEVQNDSLVKQQSKPVCLPQVKDTTTEIVTITLGKMRIKEPSPTKPIIRDTTTKDRF
jgi:hypothetical protein